RLGLPAPGFDQLSALGRGGLLSGRQSALLAHWWNQPLNPCLPCCSASLGRATHICTWTADVKKTRCSRGMTAVQNRPGSVKLDPNKLPNWAFVEPMTGIEPAYSAWEAVSRWFTVTTNPADSGCAGCHQPPHTATRVNSASTLFRVGPDLRRSRSLRVKV